MTKKPTKAQRLATIEEARTLLALIALKYREAFVAKAELVMALYMKSGAIDVEKLDKSTRAWAISQFGAWRGNGLAPHTRRFWQLMTGRDEAPYSVLGTKPVKAAGVASEAPAATKPVKMVFDEEHAKLLLRMRPDNLTLLPDDPVEETIWWYWLGEWQRALSRGLLLASAPRSLEQFVRLQKVMLQQNLLPDLEADLVATLLHYGGSGHDTNDV